MKKKVSRKQLIKGGAGGALAVGVLGPGAAPAFAGDDGGGGLQIHVHGNLQGYGATPPTARLAVSFDVFGRKSSLAGAGWDGGTGGSFRAGAGRAAPGRAGRGLLLHGLGLARG